ncbi:MAG: hypothetical protein ACP5E4_00030 [Candidatus Aenigmatarchaeota archaeon]
MERKVIFSLGVLLLACLVLSPLVHEYSHMAAFRSLSGYYFMDVKADSSVHGSFEALSPLSLAGYSVVLAVGIASSFIIGGILVYRGRKKECHISTMAGIGFLLNPSIAMLFPSDMSVLLSFVGLEGISLALGLFIIGLCVIEANFAAKLITRESS